MLTDRSSRCRGEYPQTVAGRKTTPVKVASVCFFNSGSHMPLFLLEGVSRRSGTAPVTSGLSGTPLTELEEAKTRRVPPAFVAALRDGSRPHTWIADDWPSSRLT